MSLPDGSWSTGRGSGRRTPEGHGRSSPKVENDLKSLGVAAVVTVSRIGDVAAGVADPGADDAREPADQLFHAPEATTGEDRGFCRSRHLMSFTLFGLVDMHNRAEPPGVPEAASRSSHGVHDPGEDRGP